MALLIALSLVSAPSSARGDVIKSSLFDRNANSKNTLSPSQVQKVVEEYQQVIDILESSEGVYGATLSQELLNLGNLYQQYNQHELAIKTFKRALHLTRVNEGLYSTAQTPIAEKLINSYYASKQWGKVESQLSYIYWLARQNFGNNSIKLLDVTLQIAHWNIKSFALRLKEEPVLDLVSGYYTLEKAIELIKTHYGEKDPRLIAPLRDLQLVNYLIAVSPVSIDSTLKKSSQRNMAIEDTNITSKIGTLKSKSYVKGEELIEFELSVQKAMNDQPINVGNTMLKLADWYLLFGKRNRANRNYQAAFEYVDSQISDDEIVTQMFSKPVALPDFPRLNNTFVSLEGTSMVTGKQEYVLASLDVTPYGKPRNIEIVNDTLKSNATKNKLMRILRQTQFRPTIARGTPVLAENIQLHIYP